MLSDSNLGGAGTWLLNYAAGYSREQIELAAVLPRNAVLTPLLRETGIRLVEADIAPDQSMDRQSVRVLQALFRELRPEIVTAHGSFSARIAARKSGAQVVFVKHTLSRPRAGIKKRLTAFLDNHYCDRAVAVSHAAAQNLLENGLKEEKIAVLPNGCGKIQPLSPEEAAAVRARYGIPPQARVCSIVARLEPIKDHDTFLKAAAQALKEEPDLWFLIAGDGSLKGALEARAQELGIAARCTFAGMVTEVRNIYGVTDLLALTSRMENLPISLCEAMSAHVPVVATAVGGVPEMLRDGVSGLLAPAGDAQKLSEQMAALCRDRMLSQKLADAAYDIWKETYSREAFCHRIDELYLQMKGRGTC